MSAAAYTTIACGGPGAGPAGAMHLADPVRGAMARAIRGCSAAPVAHVP